MSEGIFDPNVSLDSSTLVRDVLEGVSPKDILPKDILPKEVPNVTAVVDECTKQDSSPKILLLMGALLLLIVLYVFFTDKPEVTRRPEVTRKPEVTSKHERRTKEQ